ncbi:MAG: Fimbrial assembly family protein [Candidatus Saccharibacteria bacterium]|nr:Fimbrial assembly family protein [Candidatus Saccharibacteria bacterium]
MINLLPGEHKKQIRAARTNVLLVRYNLLIIFSVAFIAGAIGFSFLYLASARQVATDAIEGNVNKEGSYAAVKTEADSFRGELANAKVILDGQTSYAKAALNIAKLLPPGTALGELKLDQQSFVAPLILSVNVTNEQAASQLIKNFKESPYFSAVTKNKISIGTGAYPYTMEISVMMNKAAAQ